VQRASAAVRDLAVHRSSAPIAASPGEPVEIRELIEAVNRLGYELSLYDQSRREFASDIAHELHSLTSAMQTAAEALARGAGESDPTLGQRLVSGMAGHARRLDRLANDLLELARMESGRMPLEADDVELGALTRNVVDAWTAEAHERSMELELWAPDEPLWTRADPVRLAQAIGNLIENGLKYAGSGGSICLTVRDDPEHGGREIIVDDSGPGIPADVLPRVFDRYFRVEGRAGSGPGGMGLGLAIARSIARGHGGDLHAENGKDSGARFILRIPPECRFPG
jgi:two-component system sensor histidine kinase BaeS